MKLCDFPLLSGELAKFTCDDLGPIGKSLRPCQYRHTVITIFSDMATPFASAK
jgi:hypothetical protein